MELSKDIDIDPNQIERVTLVKKGAKLGARIATRPYAGTGRGSRILSDVEYRASASRQQEPLTKGESKRAVLRHVDSEMIKRDVAETERCGAHALIAGKWLLRIGPHRSSGTEFATIARP